MCVPAISFEIILQFYLNLPVTPQNWEHHCVHFNVFANVGDGDNDDYDSVKKIIIILKETL